MPPIVQQRNLTYGPGGRIGALISFATFLVALFSSWATYSQFALGLTYLTLPVLIGAACIGISLLTGFKPPKLVISDYCIICIYAICLLSYSWSIKPSAWPLQIYWYSICFLVYFSVRLFIVTPARIKLTIYGVLIGSIIGGILISEQTSEWGQPLERGAIEGVNSNFTAYILAGSFYIFIITCRSGLLPQWMAFLTIPLAIFTFIKLNFLGTRGALFSLTALWLWIILHKAIPKITITPLVLLSTSAVLLYTSGALDLTLTHIDSYFNRGTGDLSGRIPVWSLAREYIMDNFFLGIGVGSFTLSNHFAMGAHNVFLTFLLEVGFIGFMLFMLFLFDLFYPALKKNAPANSKFILGAFFSFWLPIAGSGHWELAPFSWLTLGLTLNILSLKKVNYA